MKDHRKIVYLVVMFFASVIWFLVGCAEVKVKRLSDYNPPQWALKGSGAFGGDKKRVLYGVGIGSGIKDLSLLRQAADNRARNELAKILEVYTSSLMRDYAASTTAGDTDVRSDEQHIESAVKTITSATISGIEIVDHWEHPENGDLFSLARLDIETFKQNLEHVKELNKEVRDFIRENAERLQEKLEKEEQKR
ncbi:MAG: LPP20 family lipoprotein [Nitrospirae bacterium]|nr:LPP20 family lipoprotein [Nitrospirota bacterium]